MAKYVGETLSRVPDEETKVILADILDRRDVESLVDFLMMLGGSNRGLLGSDHFEHYQNIDKKKDVLCPLYPAICDIVCASYDTMIAIENEIVRHEGCGRGVHFALRELCVLYLNLVGCECGKVFDRDYFEEDASHGRCTVFRKYAWAHLPNKMRQIYGIIP